MSRYVPGNAWSERRYQQDIANQAAMATGTSNTSSPTRDNARAASPIKNTTRDNSPTRSNIRTTSPTRDGARTTSPTRYPTRSPSLSRPNTGTTARTQLTELTIPSLPSPEADIPTPATTLDMIVGPITATEAAGRAAVAAQRASREAHPLNTRSKSPARRTRRGTETSKSSRGTTTITGTNNNGTDKPASMLAHLKSKVLTLRKSHRNLRAGTFTPTGTATPTNKNIPPTAPNTSKPLPAITTTTVVDGALTTPSNVPDYTRLPPPPSTPANWPLPSATTSILALPAPTLVPNLDSSPPATPTPGPRNAAGGGGGGGGSAPSAIITANAAGAGGGQQFLTPTRAGEYAVAVGRPVLVEGGMVGMRSMAGEIVVDDDDGEGLEGLRDGVALLHGRVEGVEAAVVGGEGRLCVRLEGIESRLGRVEGALGRVEERVAGVESRLVGLEAAVGRVEEGLGRLEGLLREAKEKAAFGGGRYPGQKKSLFEL